MNIDVQKLYIVTILISKKLKFEIATQHMKTLFLHGLCSDVGHESHVFRRDAMFKWLHDWGCVNEALTNNFRVSGAARFNGVLERIGRI